MWIKTYPAVQGQVLFHVYRDRSKNHFPIFGCAQNLQILENLYFGLYFMVLVVGDWTELSQDSVKL
jgi:hypothetical protein